MFRHCDSAASHILRLEESDWRLLKRKTSGGNSIVFLGPSPFEISRRIKDATWIIREIVGSPLTDGQTGISFSSDQPSSILLNLGEPATQVSKGLNGLVQAFGHNLGLFRERRKAEFLPVVFTTANLWTTAVDLSSADVDTGKIDLSSSDFTNEPWILYQYHSSPGLKHSHSPDEEQRTLGELMEREFIRTISVVSPSGIADFLDWSGALDFE